MPGASRAHPFRDLGQAEQRSTKRSEKQSRRAASLKLQRRIDIRERKEALARFAGFASSLVQHSVIFCQIDMSGKYDPPNFGYTGERRSERRGHPPSRCDQWSNGSPTALLILPILGMNVKESTLSAEEPQQRDPSNTIFWRHFAKVGGDLPLDEP
ncbi:MAG TPA: hypothetical protein DEP53_06655 [Bacteroidetes bacterium]|nr:hypothetical protein [Bacteroidota bacterium]